MKITNQDFHQIKKLSLFCHYILLHCINEFHPSNALIYQCQYFGDLSLIETLSPCNTIKYHAIQYNAMQYYTMQCNTMQCNAMPIQGGFSLPLLHNRTQGLLHLQGKVDLGPEVSFKRFSGKI